MTTFAIIGFGEVGSIFARDLHALGISRVAAYDIDQDARVRASLYDYVQVQNSAIEAASSADVIFLAHSECKSRYSRHGSAKPLR